MVASMVDVPEEVCDLNPQKVEMTHFLPLIRPSTDMLVCPTFLCRHVGLSYLSLQTYGFVIPFCSDMSVNHPAHALPGTLPSVHPGSQGILPALLLKVKLNLTVSCWEVMD